MHVDNFLSDRHALRQEGHVYRTRIEMSPPSVRRAMSFLLVLRRIQTSSIILWAPGQTAKLGGRRWPTRSHKSTFRRYLPLP